MNRTIEDIQKDIELLGIKGGYDIEQLLTPQDCRRLSYEIERLNNIINELEKELDRAYLDLFEYELVNGREFIANIKNYIQELKGSAKEMIAEVKRLCKYKTIYKREESILNEEERKYLSAVIKPFRNNVQYVMRRHSVIISECENIMIQYNDDTYHILKNFKAGTMYKGMKLGRIYTLEELGL